MITNVIFATRKSRDLTLTLILSIWLKRNLSITGFFHLQKKSVCLLMTSDNQALQICAFKLYMYLFFLLNIRQNSLGGLPGRLVILLISNS